MPLSAERSLTLRLSGVVLFALASFWLPKLALPACFVVLLAALTLPRLTSRAARVWARTFIVLAGVLSTGAFAGFVLHEAIPGVIAGGNQDAEKRAIGFLRNLVVAEDHVRTHAWLDPDGDGIGSAASFTELAGLSPLRNGARPQSLPLYLKPADVSTSASETLVTQGAFLFKLCLPTRNTGFTSGDNLGDVDFERSERNFVAYAWPKSFAPGNPRDCYAVDAYERILMYKPTAATTLRYQGEQAGPDCDAVVTQPENWAAWKGKTPRPNLPGDSLATALKNTASGAP